MFGTFFETLVCACFLTGKNDREDLRRYEWSRLLLKFSCERVDWRTISLNVIAGMFSFINLNV